jgi:hypothetical protein
MNVCIAMAASLVGPARAQFHSGLIGPRSEGMCAQCGESPTPNGPRGSNPLCRAGKHRYPPCSNTIAPQWVARPTAVMNRAPSIRRARAACNNTEGAIALKDEAHQGLDGDRAGHDCGRCILRLRW